jgi:plastocyanin
MRNVVTSSAAGPRRIGLALACAAGMALATGPALAAGGPVTHTVVMQATSYAPQALTVKRGDTVVWINKDPYPHTATAKGVFDSGGIGDGGSWGYTAREPGEHPYICTFHPNMKATLRVQ